MATLLTRQSTTNPRSGSFHVVKPAFGINEYSFRIGYSDFLAAIKQDHPIVIDVYPTAADLPGGTINLGTLAVIRAEGRLYIYDVDGWVPAVTGASEVLTVENTSVYDPNTIYDGGNVFVSYVNPESSNPIFQTASIYRSIFESAKGISPEDSLYNIDTNPAGKWENQGNEFSIVTSNTSTGVVSSLAELRAIEGMKTGDTVIVTGVKYWYRFASNVGTGIKPNDGSAGSWLRKSRFNESNLIDIVDSQKIGNDFYLPYRDDCLIVLVPGLVGMLDANQIQFYITITQPSFIVKTGLGFTESDYKVMPISEGSGGSAVDYRNEATAITLTAADIKSVIRYTGATDITVTIPENTILLESEIVLRQSGAGIITLIAEGGVVLNTSGGLNTNGQHTEIFLNNPIEQNIFDMLGGVE